MKRKDIQSNASVIGDDEDSKQWHFKVLKRLLLIFKTVQQHAPMGRVPSGRD
jgi:hypothetical protein